MKWMQVSHWTVGSEGTLQNVYTSGITKEESPDYFAQRDYWRSLAEFDAGEDSFWVLVEIDDDDL